MLSSQGLLDDEITQAINRQYDAMLVEYNSSSFGAKEPRTAVDARTVYFHLKQQGRVILDSLGASAARRLSVLDGAASVSPMRYRLSDVKSRQGLDSSEAYATWKDHWWKEHVREHESVKINSAARGVLARKKTRELKHELKAAGGSKRPAPRECV